jgi:hypothetical protein
MAADTGQKSWLDRWQKWVVAVTALLSLLFALQKLTQTISENNVRKRQIGELTQVAQRQQAAGDYAAAWESIGSALTLAESGGTLAKMIGHLDAETVALRAAREDVAMAWLDDIHKPGDQKFSDIVSKVQPALEQGAVNVTAQRQADLLAHVGWGYFLRGRDGVSAPDPQAQYDQAIRLDGDNPYAHAYLGHWMLWKGADISAAAPHFATALNAGRAKKLVRRLQLAAYQNRQSGGDVPFVAAVGEMLRNGEEVPADSQSLALWHITRACASGGSEELRAELRRSISDADLLSEYRTLQTTAHHDNVGNAAAEVEACLARH